MAPERGQGAVIGGGEVGRQPRSYENGLHKALAAEKTSLTQYSMEFGTTPYWCDNFSGSIATHRPCALTTGATGGTFWPLGTLEAETSAPPFWTCMSLCENRCLEA
ncbi:hypothetical protein MCOR07_007353 [Pyricularia oryzae]|uniref:Uncharacterized protein n=2 Tax=Pyricularia oryzae TaxID=318829 RepID=A0AA97PGA8_PYRO3|nr:hypothetical protein OOU_Y34scaffold00927g16 [Pyricularia oryzae Y34]KAI6275263.1 hypothetical protein MCOR26_006089 [Pyricularia oryzae]KAI6309841.1 hypothetical protein MCOR29_008811 [Pyricularia oryzae]KAI6359201.1 hypothetical protein MCOR32_009352 [Pyricularia oryzae]KAI6364682.1 hypothetical protein MCOR31_007285 [Pyricularia oryzae]